MDILIERLNDYKYKLIGVGVLLTGLAVFKKRYISGFKYLSSQTLNDKTVIITGSNTGIGYETALDLARRGATVIMACRDVKQAQISCDTIRRQTNNQNVSVEQLDLASFDSVKEFFNRIMTKLNRLDILINNAGVMACPFTKTIDGYEHQFQVNYLSHYLLTRLLIDKLKYSSPSRIINVTSKLYETGRVNWNDLNMEDCYEPTKAYKQSKLCNILFTNQLVLYLKQDNLFKVNAYSVSPGIVLTNLGRYFYLNKGFMYKICWILFYPIMWFLLKTPKQGAQTTIYCAVEPSLEESTGGFYRNGIESQLRSHATDLNDAKRLWDLSESLVKKWL